MGRQNGEIAGDENCTKLSEYPSKVGVKQLTNWSNGYACAFV